ncbi:2'-5' RNA ligase family protein [Rhodanobacter lindaniclasticus]
MTETAFIIRVPEAEPRVGGLRERFDASSRLGVPAHVTVLYPFMPPERITGDVLHRAQGVFDAVPAFSFALSRIARFPDVVYLAPEPAAPFVALTQALARCFPDYPPFRGEHDTIIPHLTVAHGHAADTAIAERELVATMRAHGAIHASCRAISLLEQASGRWRERHVFASSGDDSEPGRIVFA